jgi:hypothetical protein
MRIYKKRPFSDPNSVRVNAIALDFERVSRAKRDLTLIKSFVDKGKMTRELYDFLNTDGSMDHLFIGLPKPITGVACESLAIEQNEVLDAAIESSSGTLVNVIKSMWDAFKEWFLDWWDVNRDIRFKLQNLKTAFENDPYKFGNEIDFKNTVINNYSQVQWSAMLNACKDINAVLSSMPTEASKLEEWFKKNITTINNGFGEFGQAIIDKKDEQTGKVMYLLAKGNPKYDPTDNTLESGRWKYTNLGTYAENVIGVLNTDEENRRTFGRLESVFKTATYESVDFVKTLRKIVMRNGANVFVVARSIEKIFHRCRANASPQAQA